MLAWNLDNLHQTTEATMQAQKLFGIVLLIVGLILLYLGWQSSQSAVDQLAEAFTGRFTDDTLFLLIGGVVAVIVGAVLTFVRK